MQRISCTRARAPSLQQTSDIESQCRATIQVILAADVPMEVWNSSAVLRELGAHPSHAVSTSDFHNRVDATLDVSVLFGYSTHHVKAAEEYVAHGIIRPASVLTLSRLCLAPTAAMTELGFAPTHPRHSFRDVICRHLECLGPRTGVWDSVREIPGLAATVSHLVEFKAWSTAPGTCEMSGWLERTSLKELSSNGCWWLVMWALRAKVHVELDCVFLLAAEYGCLHIVKRLCDVPSVDLGMCDNWAIKVATLLGHVQVVEHLCSLPPERGVLPRYALMSISHATMFFPLELGVRSRRALMCARDKGNLAVVQYLCSLPLARGVGAAFCNQALAVAAEYGQLPVVEYLCSLPPERGVDPSVQDALVFAAFRGHLPVVEYLCSLPLERGVDPSSGVLLPAVRWRRLSVVKYLCSLPLERCPDQSARNEALDSAASTSNLAIVEYLCCLPPERGVDPSTQGNMAFLFAACRGHLPVVEYLCSLPLERGVDPSAQDNMTLQLAAFRGHLPVVEYLRSLPLERGVDPSAQSRAGVVREWYQLALRMDSLVESLYMRPAAARKAAQYM